MAIIDLRGASVSAADPPIATNPSPDLAWKAPVRAATTGSNITLSGTQTLDGVSLAVGDRVLVKDQTNAVNNGIYNVQSGPWTRTIDANNSSQWTTQTMVAVSNGSTNATSSFALTTAIPVLVGTSNLTFALIAFPPPVAGAPPNQRSVTASPITIASNDQILNVNIGSGSPTCALPAAAGRTGSSLTFKDIGGNFAAHNLTLTPNGAEKIDGASSLVLNVNYQGVTIRPFNDGINSGWSIQ